MDDNGVYGDGAARYGMGQTGFMGGFRMHKALVRVTMYACVMCCENIQSAYAFLSSSPLMQASQYSGPPFTSTSGNGRGWGWQRPAHRGPAPARR